MLSFTHTKDPDIKLIFTSRNWFETVLSGSTYLETTRVQIHANVRIRRIYFSDMLYSEEEMPNEFRLYKPVPASKKPSADEVKEKAKGSHHKR